MYHGIRKALQVGNWAHATAAPRAGKFCTAGTVADLVVLYAIPGTLSAVACARHVKGE